ncbi:MAG: serine hydrolase [Planctomycetes bacterium]|nr:serine hydrolase [Planctomycetota bacterium]
MPASPPQALLLTSLCLPLAAQASPQLTPELAQVAAAYAAKVTASALFVSGRTLDSVLAEELAPDRPLDALIGPLLQFAVDRDAGTVTCTLAGAKATAVATRNLGCTLATATVPVALLRRRVAPDVPSNAPHPNTVDWPVGERTPDLPAKDANVDAAALARAVDAAFAEPEGKTKVRTRALVVVCRGRIVAERYAPGYTATMPLPGWSMTKTLVGALVGIAVGNGTLDLEAELAVPEWPAADPRRDLRLPDLLGMSSGLAWRESYDDPSSDALRMLFASGDHAATQASQPREVPPGTRFRYSSGTTNLICRELRTAFARGDRGGDRAYWAMPRQELFRPLAMHTAVLETDPSGTFVGSSYGFACARDWARFGMLLLGDGTFAGRRVLPAGWVARMAAPSPASAGRFGSHLWLNADPDGDGPRERQWPALPADLVHLDGHEGQYVAVFPTQQIVVVRLGCTKAGGFGLRPLLEGVLAACGG